MIKGAVKLTQLSLQGLDLPLAIPDVLVQYLDFLVLLLVFHSRLLYCDSLDGSVCDLAHLLQLLAY